MFTLQLPKRDERGFTLIELLVVIIIIGILAAVAIPLFLDQRKLAVDASVKSDVRNTATQVQTWLAINPGQIATDATDYQSKGGKVANSTGNTVKLSVATDGSYLVCGYAGTSAKAYTASTAAYVFDSTTGRFGLGDCASGIVGAGNPSTSSAATGAQNASAATAAANDNYANAADLGTIALNGSYTYTAANTGATMETGEYSFRMSSTNAPYVGATVWAKIKPLASGTLTASTCVASNTATTDTMIAVFNSGGFASANFVGGNDDAGGTAFGTGATSVTCPTSTRLSTVLVPVVANNTYYVQLAGYNGANFTGMATTVGLS